MLSLLVYLLIVLLSYNCSGHPWPIHFQTKPLPERYFMTGKESSDIFNGGNSLLFLMKKSPYLKSSHFVDIHLEDVDDIRLYVTGNTRRDECIISYSVYHRT